MVAPDGVELAAIFYPPVGDGAPAPGVLLFHMWGRTKEDWRYFARTLQAAGYAALAVDLRGHGQSGGGTPAMLPEDAQAAWEFLAADARVDPTRMAVVGASGGANLALELAARLPQVKTVVLLSPGLPASAQAVMADYGARPLLIATSVDDSTAEASRTLDGLAQGEHRLELYAGAAHGSDIFGVYPELTDLIVAWLDKYVRESPGR